MKIIFVTVLFFTFSFCLFAQSEILTNQDVILMTRAGLSNDLIIRKIKDTKGKFETTTQALIDLKKSGVSDTIIKLMMEKEKTVENKKADDDSTSFSNSDNPPSFDFTASQNSRIVINKKEALLNAKTIAIIKSSLHPSRQALEKELLKRKDWKSLGLNIVRHKENADLYLEIGYVSMSWITHRYVYRVFDNKSGTVIIAGETTSWGSLAKNLARGISKRLAKL